MIPIHQEIRSYMGDKYVKERDRSRIPDTYKWNLADVYPDEKAWRNAKSRVAGEFPRVGACKGTLAESPQALLHCLDLISRLEMEQTKLSCYASLNSDLDTRHAGYLAMEQEIGQMGADFAALASFVEPEILAMGREVIERFLNHEPQLETYRHPLDDILRKKEHTGTETEEKIIADAGLIADSPGTIYSIFSNADFPFPEVVFEDGSSVRLDPPSFSLHRRSPVREDWRKVFAAYLGKMHEFRRTFGA